ncbi:MAG: hypothetical protein ABL865_00775 [Candidatus Nitrotoga sp.]
MSAEIGCVAVLLRMMGMVGEAAVGESKERLVEKVVYLPFSTENLGGNTFSRYRQRLYLIKIA